MLAYDSVILAGGQGRRLADQRNRTDKAALLLGDESLIFGAVKASADAHTCVVVGRTLAPLPAEIQVIPDDLPDAGPAYALRAGISTLHSPWVLVLSCDVPGAPEGVPHLIAAAATLPEDVDGVIALDDEGKQQWLMGIYRTPSLRKALADIRPNTSLRHALASLSLAELPMPRTVTQDVDTWADHAWWLNRRLHSSGGAAGENQAH